MIIESLYRWIFKQKYLTGDILLVRKYPEKFKIMIGGLNKTPHGISLQHEFQNCNYIQTVVLYKY